MDNKQPYRSQKELIQQIEFNLNRIEEGEFGLDELEEQLELIRTLYERTVVLQYKAFEHYHNTQENNTNSSIEENTISARTNTEQEPIAEQTSVEYDFSNNNLFSATDSDPTDDDQAIEPIIETSHSPIQQLFYDILSQTEGKIGVIPLSSLNDSFGLNERMLFINELFGGSSDEFMRAIEFLDTIPMVSSSISFFEELSKKYQWDISSQEVEDFIIKICQKYA